MSGHSRASRRARHSLSGVAAFTLLAGVAACSDDGDGDEEAGYEATIRRTAEGVPHITGESLGDVMFGQGYASGEDRACDLADQVIKVRGERARFLGPGEDDANIESDMQWRAIGIFDRAAGDWQDASEEATEVVTAFTEGWNAHLDEVGVDDLPGWCAGADWVRPLEPVEVYAYGRSIALQASSGAVIDFIGTAQPPGSGDEPEDEAASTGEMFRAGDNGSNGWAVGSERSADGGGMLIGNPHFPWDGELRFWESHLTIPGELDVYGAQLSGLPGVGIGFNDNVGWTHTVSAGNRFTMYRLDLVDGDPTSYQYGDEEREMDSTEIAVEVLGEDGEVEEVTRTIWSTHYGPVLNIPELPWSEETAFTFRDGNLDDAALFEQYLGMSEAQSMDELIEVHEEVTGVPLFNTIAVSNDGRAWYADTSATPNLSEDAIAAYEDALETDPIVAAVLDQGAVLLEGSDPENEWVEAEGARSPGLVPFEDMPQVERDDYVFNANDSFWMPHATEMLEGDYSPLHGRQETARTPRTRENATVLGDTSAEGPAGEDGLFTLDELAAAAVQNRGYTSRALLDDVVERCDGVDTVEVDELPSEGDAPGLPAATVDISEACGVLADWDGVYDLDRAGPPIWREMLTNNLTPADLREAGPLWAEDFDPGAPVETPSGLAPAPDEGEDPVLQWLGRAVQVLEAADYPVDVPLGEIQFAPRAGETIPIHGGDNYDGTTNIVRTGSGPGGTHSILDPELDVERERVVGTSELSTIGDDTGYLINGGTSFLMALEYTDEGPQAQVFLTYGNTEDRSSPLYVEATQAFSEKEWRTVLLDQDEIEDAAVDTKTVSHEF